MWRLDKPERQKFTGLFEKTLTFSTGVAFFFPPKPGLISRSANKSSSNNFGFFDFLLLSENKEELDSIPRSSANKSSSSFEDLLLAELNKSSAGALLSFFIAGFVDANKSSSSSKTKLFHVAFITATSNKFKNV